MALCSLLFIAWALVALLYPLILPQKNLMANITILASSLLPIYFSYKLLMLLPWLNVSILVVDNGFVVRRGSDSRKYIWEEVGYIEFSNVVKACKIFTKRKELISALYLEFGDFSEFIDMLEKDVPDSEGDYINSYAPGLKKIFESVERYRMTRRIFFLSFVGVLVDSYTSTVMWSYFTLIMMVVYGATSMGIAAEKCPRCKKNYFGSLFWDEAADRGLWDIENARCKNCGLSMSLLS